jgi:hypothetical protein
MIMIKCHWVKTTIVGEFKIAIERMDFNNKNFQKINYW